MYRLAYIVTHPIQYQAPLLRYLAQSNEIDLEVFFLSDFSLHAHYEQAFNHTFKWDVALTDGYAWEVLPRVFLGASRPLRPWWPVSALRRRLREGRFDAVWVHGWGHSAYVRPFEKRRRSACRCCCVENHCPTQQRRTLRRNSATRSVIDCSSGSPDFYASARATVIFINSSALGKIGSFRCLTPLTTRSSNPCAQRYGHSANRFAVRSVCCGAPGDSVRREVHHREGARRTSVRVRPGLRQIRRGLGAISAVRRRRPPARRARSARLGDAVRFLGFRNQSELPALYDLCDVFALPSRFEPWGLVVNEAMNAGRPVIVSDRVGAAADLVEDGVNGFVYPSGDLGALASRLIRDLRIAGPARQMGERCLERITSWDFEADRRGLVEALSAVCRKQKPVECRRMNGGIAVAYSGVHQAYQLALAAQELGRLDRFYCSMFAAEGKWGGVFARMMGSDALVNRRVDGLSSKRVCENPWPL